MSFQYPQVPRMSKTTFRPPAPVGPSSSPRSTVHPKFTLIGNDKQSGDDTSQWEMIEELIRAQYEAIRISTERLTQIVTILQGSASTAESLSPHIAAQHAGYPLFSSKDSALFNRENVQQSGGMTDGGQPLLGDTTSTLVPTLPLDELIDMRQFEAEFDGLRPSQGGAPGQNLEEVPESDGMDYETMSLSSDVDMVPPEFHSDRLPTPFDFPRPSTPIVPQLDELDPGVGTPAKNEAKEEKRGLRTRRERPDYVNHPMDAGKRRTSSSTQATPKLRKPAESTPENEEPEVDELASESGSDDGRSVRGMSTAEVAILPVSDGQRYGLKWWPKGRNDLHGRMVSRCLHYISRI